MADDIDRTDSGEFSERVTDEDILRLFDEAKAPFLTASEIAEQLPITRQAVNHRLQQLHETGQVDRKQVGARAVGWWRSES